jgi:hypothetical protein
MNDLLTVIRKNRASVLQEWLQGIKGGIRRRDLIDDRSLEAQASELLSAIVEVSADARLDDFTGAVWQPTVLLSMGRCLHFNHALRWDRNSLECGAVSGSGVAASSATRRHSLS